LRGLGPLLAPPALLFGTAVRARNLLFDRGILRAARAPVPVISIGNLTVGGSGKTPVARWILERLVERGRRPGLVARGYGADELELHRRWHPGIPVVRAPRRVDGVREAAERGADVCVLDDGFQHRGLARDLDIVLVAASDPFPPRLLPRGPFREPLAGAQRADLVLVTSRTRAEAERGRELARELSRGGRCPPVYPFPFAAGRWLDLEGRPASPPDAPTLVVSSVARPDGVATLAAEAGAEIADRMPFPDHHAYDARDVARIRRRAEGRLLLTTEKDAVKLRAFGPDLGPGRVLTMRPTPDPAVVRALERALDEALPGSTVPAGGAG
jgi:tetraacyldisaccharide 4'-kinase